MPPWLSFILFVMIAGPAIALAEFALVIALAAFLARDLSRPRSEETRCDSAMPGPISRSSSSPSRS
jgi:hypothetical protein